MSPYVPYLAHLDNDQKELLFQVALAQRLALINYRFMRPTPDIGTDILIFDARQIFICAAQLKSSYSIKYIFQGRIQRYMANIRASRLEASFDRKFLYFFGLYIPPTYPPDFHIGCIPSSFFQSHWELLHEKFLQKDGRINIEIDYDMDEGRFFALRRPIEVTRFFNNLDAIG